MGGVGAMEWDEWECDCARQSAPPVFNIPPPPPPPDLLEQMVGPSSRGAERACGALWSCPVLLGAREDHGPAESKIPVAVVVVTALTLVLIVIMVAAIVYRLRINRCRSTKNCTELNGGIIYEDLPSGPPILIPPQGRPPPRYKSPVPHSPHHQHPQLMMHQPHPGETSLHVYTPEPPHLSHHPTQHGYHSISSGGETCSCSISETPSCSLLPHGPSPECSSPAVRQILSSDDDTPSGSPYHYYNPRRPSNSTLYESLYYTGSASSSRSSSSQPRAPLPPLPSRSDRFRIYFSNDRRGAGTATRRHNPHSQQGVTLVPPAPPEIVPLYENVS